MEFTFEERVIIRAGLRRLQEGIDDGTLSSLFFEVPTADIIQQVTDKLNAPHERS